MISDRISSLFFICISVIFLVGALCMPIGQPNEPGPGFMPLFLGVIMVLISGGLLLQGFFRPEPTSSELMNRGSIIRIALSVVGLVLYCVLLPFVGFFFVTFLFEIAYMKLFGVTKWRTILMVAITATLGAFLLFDTLLQIPFPKGSWWG